jgi:hypothetical protein
MSDTTQETYARANSSSVMTYNSINDALEITTLTLNKRDIRSEF